MHYRKKTQEEHPEENTAIWSCPKEGCNGWMRDDFAFEYVPTCHQCSSVMIRSMKMLPFLVNTNRDLKTIKKGIQIR